MARIAIEVGPLSFPTKTAAVAHYQAILYAYEPNVPIPDPHATELEWLLDRHPEVEQKRGAGVRGFRVIPAMMGTRCFAIERIDGSSTDFSFRSCVDGRAPSPMQEMVQAMRAEVRADIQAAKRRHFDERADADGRVPCAVTGTPVTFEECHADHAPPRPFSSLALLFLGARLIVPDGSHVTAPADNQLEPRLADGALAAAWREFHHREAAIRIVARRSNLGGSAQAKVRRKDRQLKLG